MKQTLVLSCARLPYNTAMICRGSASRFVVYAAFAVCLVSASLGCNRRLNGSSAEAQEVYVKGQQLAKNAGFEGSGTMPTDWAWDRKQSGSKGSVSQDQSTHHSGSSSLKLQPNRNNVAEDPLAITQTIPAGTLRGQLIEFSAYMRDEGDTQAILGILALVHGVPQGKPDMLFANADASGEWVQHRKTFRVPDDASVQLVLICMSNGRSGASWFDDVSVVSLRAATGPELHSQLPVDTTPLSATVKVDGIVLREIPRTLYGTNIEWRWNALNLWQPRLGGTDPKLTELTKDLGVSVIRYPGGMFSDFYHWKTGVGPLDQRREVRHEPGKPDKSTPYFGTDEVLTFAQQTGAEVWMTANAGTGTAQEAGDWVKYCNGQTERVRFWEVGNELYIRDPAPEFSTITVDAATYSARFGEFARSMRAADPNIKIAAIGGINYGHFAFMGYPRWLETVLQQHAQDIDFISIHNAYAPIIADDNVEFRDVYRAMMGASVAIGRNLQTVSDTIAKYAPARASQIKIAVTEWGPAFRFDLNSRWVDHPKTLGSALFAASVMNTLIQAPKVEVANFLMLHDFSVYGAIGSRNTDFPPKHDWIPTARYYAFQLYTKHFGKLLLRSSTEVPTFDSPTVGYTDGATGVPYLDVVCSLSEDKHLLYIMAVNKNFDRPIDAAIRLSQFIPAQKAVAWTLNGRGLDANTGTGIIRAPGLRVPRQEEDPLNPRFYKGAASEISFESSDVKTAGGNFIYRFPAHSVTSIMLTRR